MFCNLVQRLALPILVALATLTPIRSAALVQSPTLPGSPSDLSVLVEEVPEYVAILVETPEGLCWVICRNDPINNTDPTGLDVFQYEGAKILGLVETPSGYAPYFRGTTFIEDVGAQIANAGSLFANTFWNTLEGVNCVVTAVDESPKALGGSKTITQMQEPLGPLAFATGGGELKVAMILGSLSRVARIEGVVARGVVLEKSVAKTAKNGSLRIASYGEMSGDVAGQTHHLNQTAAFRDVIPKSQGLSIELQGNVFRDAGAPHTLAHQSLEGFWNTFRGTEIVPSNLQYTRALQQSLRASGLSEVQVQQAVQAAIRERVQSGLLGGMEVPRVPGPIRNIAQ